MSHQQDLRLAVDIGGTFTDVVLMGEDGVILASHKIPTTHANPGDGALAGVRRVVETSAVSLDQIRLFSAL